MLNKEITSKMLAKFKSLSLANQPNGKGKFFADKSYAFDTVFFCSRFISRFRFGNKYYKLDLQEKSNKYIEDLFCLEKDSSQIQNYMTETVALLCFARILEPTRGKKGVFTIIDDELLEFISASFENSYIFQFLLAYQIFQNEGLWNIYKQFCNEKTTEKKQEIYDKYRLIYAKKDARVKDLSKEWANFTPKYPMVILNYINGQNMCTRTATVKDDIVKIGDISLNQEGTRAGKQANAILPKKNSYLEDFSLSYIVESLRPYLLRDYPKYKEIIYSDSFSIDVADVKLDMLDEDRKTEERKRKMQDEKYKMSGGQKVRTVQGEFRDGLLKTIPPKCPVCGFEFRNFLIASHIKPYAKCEDTYDAMNPNNGLLMCPICDKLFESANYMTIDHKDGKVVYDPNLDNEKDFKYLNGKVLPINYVDCERKHYLKWHNEEYKRKHPDT